MDIDGNLDRWIDKHMERYIEIVRRKDRYMERLLYGKIDSWTEV